MCIKDRVLKVRDIPGEDPWGPGATSTAEWTGVRLADVLSAAGLQPAAAHIAFEAPDVSQLATPPHVDATVLIERPHLAGMRDQIRGSLADARGIGPGQVSVKATRGEGLGCVGREEGAAALAVATVQGR